MLIAVVNLSTIVSGAEVQAYIGAQVHQLRYDLCPAWGISVPSVVAYQGLTAIPAGAQVVTLLDTSDQAGALAYHDEAAGGAVFSKVFTKTLVANGVSWQSGASHEVCEMTVDPHVQLSATNYATNNTYAFEVCDPVESDTYTINGIEVSDFVYPAWFDSFAAHGTRTRKGTSKGFPNLAPFQIASGGYAIKNGQAVFGETYPEWRKPFKAQPDTRGGTFVR